MPRSLLTILFLLTMFVVSSGQLRDAPGQSGSTAQNMKSQMSLEYLKFSRLNLDKYLESIHTLPCVNISEKDKPCSNLMSTALQDFRVILYSGNKDYSKKGKQVQSQRQMNLVRLYCLLYTKDPSSARASSGNVTGTVDDPSHFVSYYPGLLNEKIL